MLARIWSKYACRNTGSGLGAQLIVVVAWAMRPLFLGALLVISVGCSNSKSSDPLVGNYVGWMVLTGSASELNGSQGMLEKLSLKADGTFEYEMNSTVMVTVKKHATGTYKHIGNTVELTGTSTGFMDDGYKNEPDNGSFSMKANIVKDMLELGAYSSEHYLRKEGTGPPPASKAKK